LKHRSFRALIETHWRPRGAIAARGGVSHRRYRAGLIRQAAQLAPGVPAVAAAAVPGERLAVTRVTGTQSRQRVPPGGAMIAGLGDRLQSDAPKPPAGIYVGGWRGDASTTRRGAAARLARPRIPRKLRRFMVRASSVLGAGHRPSTLTAIHINAHDDDVRLVDGDTTTGGTRHSATMTLRVRLHKLVVAHYHKDGPAVNR
jgi:hypothetical protein